MLNLPPFVHKQRHPLGPMIIFSYGMTKCGSTLAFELARTALEINGFPQPHLSDQAVGPSRKINFIQHIDDHRAKRLLSEIRGIGHPIVIKTHTRPDIPVIDMINRGQAQAQATYRDPREMALSMLDHGARARALGKPAFAEFETLDQVLGNIHSQIDSLTQWLYRSNTLPVYFEDVAFDTLSTTRRIMAHLHLDGSAEPVVKHVLNRRFTQFNQGRRRRFRDEMSLPDQHRFKTELRRFYRHLIHNRDQLPTNGSPPLPHDLILCKTRG